MELLDSSIDSRATVPFAGRIRDKALSELLGADVRFGVDVARAVPPRAKAAANAMPARFRNPLRVVWFFVLIFINFKKADKRAASLLGNRFLTAILDIQGAYPRQ